MLASLGSGSGTSILAASFVAFAALGPAVEDGERGDGDGPDFAREVQPILSDKCFLCHGPDESSRKAGLRLDEGEEAHDSGVLELDDGFAEFLDRITTEDAASQMPPPEAKVELTPDERAILTRWIEAGAPYARHWAFEPLPASVAVPSAGSDWATSDLDRFVAQGHRSKGLDPAPRAEGARWLRRVTLDLTGLPPTPEDVLAFLADDTAQARGAVVDRLLASPAYGERMATPWLDVARYADSYGYQSDQLASVWPWRDWVVRAFNDNLPFDAFLTWQLAGDLLPEATEDQRLATAFNRLHRMTNEGGSVEEEWRHNYVVDRVETLGTAFLGLTLGCARCHDHKFDPISQAEFYGLFAYFNSIDEWGMYHDSSRIPTPSMQLMDEVAARRLERIEALAAKTRARRARGLKDSSNHQQLVQIDDDEEPWQLDDVQELVGQFAFDEWTADGKLANRIDPDGGANSSKANRLVPGRTGRALEFSGDEPVRIPSLDTTFTPLDSFSVAFWLWLPKGFDTGVVLHRSGGTDVGYFGFDLFVNEGKLQARQVRFWPGNAAAVETRRPIPTERWVHVAYVQHGTGYAEDMVLYIDGRALSETLKDSLTKLPAAGGDGLELGARFRGFGLTGGRIDDLLVVARAINRREVSLVHSGKDSDIVEVNGGREPRRFRRVRPDAWAETSPELELLLETRAALLRQRTALLEVPVMQELPKKRDAFVLRRGEYDAPKRATNRARRGVPSSIGAPESDVVDRDPVRPKGPDRLSLARWMLDPAHPLTARVAANRVWQMFFGTGLVATPGDFGLQGTPPTHPELLDWLARRYVASGWDTKALVREIVLSATYAQDSACPKATRDADPENRWLARGPSGRLSAEMVRDLALFASGLLSEERGGPPVSPYQPPGLWRENNSMSPAYKQSVGKALYRRSLYSVVKRTAPLPNMTAFDRPLRETSCARREATSTPMQGLVLLNDTQFVEAVRVLASRVLAEDPAGPIGAAFLRLAGRAPDAFESEVLADLRRVERAQFEQNPASAVELLAASGSSPLPEGADPVELASLVVTLQALFASDSVVTRR